MKKALKISALAFFAISATFLAAVFLFKHPSNNRNWSDDQKILPTARIDGNMVTIKNIRNFSYSSTDAYVPGYYDKSFDLDQIKKVYFIVEPFSEWAGAAHTFLSFEFDGGQFVAISVEIRKEQGEQFSALKGLLNTYELTYVIADERDAVKLRSNFRKDDVFIYPVKTSEEKMRTLFLDMIGRANKLADQPEFYNTLTSTCTTNIVRHINAIAPGRVPFSHKVLFPGYSDELAYDLGLIDTDLPLKKIRERYKINDKALRFADDENFSTRIREQ